VSRFFTASRYLSRSRKELSEILDRPQRRRWWLLTTNAVQTVLILLIAILEVTHGVHNERPSHFATIVLLSAGSGMQVASAKTLSVPEV
jgi:uncharacterized membrane protein YoaK (UPF0700 family)